MWSLKTVFDDVSNQNQNRCLVVVNCFYSMISVNSVVASFFCWKHIFKCISVCQELLVPHTHDDHVRTNS